MLSVRGLVKRFGGVRATDGLDLDVRAGEVHAVIGPNGAGKSTLVHQISGALRADAGSIVFAGVDVTRMAMHRRVATGLARSFQVTQVFAKLSVLDNLALAVQGRRRDGSLHFWQPAIADAQLFDEARVLAARMAISSRLEQLAGELSHGEQRRLEVALALASGARLLLLDEPMAGMDLEESASLIERLRELRASTTLLLVEHDMDAVFQLADRISVLVRGRVIVTGTPAQIRANEDVRRAYLGEDVTA